jgi:hypothetical protein
MKKHHLFLLIVCLLLVASLAFPVATPHSIIYEVSDLNDLPGRMVEGDALWIKKIMDQLSEKEGKHISFTISKQMVGKAPTPVPFNDLTKWIKGNADEVPQEYYLVPYLSAGMYLFVITIIRTNGSGSAQAPVTYKYGVEVIPANNVIETQKIREGDNHT